MEDQYGVPEIFEKEASGELAEVYRDIQFVLKVPIVNFIFRTLGLYQDFLIAGWNQVRPNLLTAFAEQEAHKLRYPDMNVITPTIKWTDYYDARTIQTITKTIFTFNYVNPKLLIIVSAWAESLSERPILEKEWKGGFIEPGVISGLPKITLVDVPQTPPPLLHLLKDIQKKHHAFDMASDFRALANYPEFLTISWNYLRGYVGSDDYNLLKEKLKRKSIKIVHKMPFPININRGMLENSYSPKEIAGIMGIVSMFQNILPGLVIDGEFFRRILLMGST